MEENVQAAVKLSSTKKVMVGGVVKLETLKTVLNEEMGEQGRSMSVLLVDICISSDENLGIWICVKNIINAAIQTSSNPETNSTSFPEVGR